MKIVKLIVYDDEEPNSMKNRLIRLIENWDFIIKKYKIKSDKQMLEHIVNRMFRIKGCTLRI